MEMPVVKVGVQGNTHNLEALEITEIRESPMEKKEVAKNQYSHESKNHRGEEAEKTRSAEAVSQALVNVKIEQEQTAETEMAVAWAEVEEKLTSTRARYLDIRAEEKVALTKYDDFVKRYGKEGLEVAGDWVWKTDSYRQEREAAWKPQDGFVLVDRRRHRQRKQTVTSPGAVHARQQPKPRPVQRRAHHRPDAIVIKAKDASKYAGILRSLKSDPTLQQKVGSSVNNIRRSAAGALVLQLKKGVENASDLVEELGRVLGSAATASALLHTSTIKIKDLDECATKEEVTEALDALLSVPVSKRDPVKSLRKAYAGTQVAVVALPDDLAAKALKLGHVRIGRVNCRIRACEKAARCYRCWSPGHVAARCKGPERTELCYRCGQKSHQAKDCKG
ncbi:unnamed protein product [Trichogramma brassicae]|uniref:CCHC-type domain-containing protein n=1 Tax=Trichogramma brassicae TaxID=86971 RepID=A0A6H5HX04_9HYME|nr:unnamed protein product [Trichogramma brassicae]